MSRRRKRRRPAQQEIPPDVDPVLYDWMVFFIRNTSQLTRFTDHGPIMAFGDRINADLQRRRRRSVGRHILFHP